MKTGVYIQKAHLDSPVPPPPTAEMERQRSARIRGECTLFPASSARCAWPGGGWRDDLVDLDTITPAPAHAGDLRAEVAGDDVWAELRGSGDPMIVRSPAPSSTSAAPSAAGDADPPVGPIEAATLNRLIGVLTPENGLYDPSFEAAFFTTYRSFTTTSVVLRKLISRFFTPESDPQPRSVLVRVGVLRSLASLGRAAFDDLTPADAHRISLVAAEARAEGFDDQVEALEQAFQRNQRALSYKPRAYFLHDMALSFPIKFHELSEEALIRLAQQFSMVEHEFYAAIRPSELLVNWDSPKNYHLTPNLRFVAQRFNAISCWAASCIAQEDIGAEGRAHTVDKLIRLCEFMRQSNNFQLLNGLLSGINMGAVQPYVVAALHKKTEKRQRLTELTELMEGQKWVMQLRRSKPPLIPFLGKYQSDLVHINDGMPSILPNGMINFAKFALVHRTICDMLQGQLYPYKYKVEPSLHYYCMALPGRLSEEELEQLANSK
eukprot:m51a1_g14746 putative ras guanine nucleotide exchange factor (492) ;mRNA; f:308788-311129